MTRAGRLNRSHVALEVAPAFGLRCPEAPLFGARTHFTPTPRPEWQARPRTAAARAAALQRERAAFGRNTARALECADWSALLAAATCRAAVRDQSRTRKAVTSHRTLQTLARRSVACGTGAHSLPLNRIFRLKNSWEQYGIARVEPFDPSLSGVDYCLKGLAAGVSAGRFYEMTKSGRAEGLTVSESLLHHFRIRVKRQVETCYARILPPLSRWHSRCRRGTRTRTA